MSSLEEMLMFNGLGMGLNTLSRLSDAQTRSISPENFDGSVGGGGQASEGTGKIHARDLGKGWKISPSIEILPGDTFPLADITGSGAIQQIWITCHGGAALRSLILRIYWDDQEHPSVEVLLGDFFANGWGRFAQVTSLPVCTNPARGFNCYWEMPFRKKARITLENRDEEDITVYYQINYTLTDVPEDCVYFHAQFRRTNPLPYKQDHVILDGIEGAGQFVGCYMAWGVNKNGWWGEGEFKFFLDGDRDYPTLCGTGTEDYFGGSHNFDPNVVDRNEIQGYREYTGPYCGLPQVIRPDGTYKAVQRFGLYRWHIMDPIRFRKILRITVQCLGWRSDSDPETRRYLARQDDLASTAFWYQTLPTVPFPPLADKDYLEII